MEALVDRIRTLCKSRGTSITKLEKKLGYGNGIIGKWAKSDKPPRYDRISRVAKELGVTPEFLLSGEKEEPPAQSGEPLNIHTVQDWKRVIDKMSQEECKEVMELLMEKFMEGGK